MINSEGPFDRAAALFEAALALAPSDRKPFLDLGCGKDAALRAIVADMLHAHLEGGSFLADKESESLISAPKSPDLKRASSLDPNDTTRIGGPVIERPGTRIGHYKLLQQIGEGGFGVVFMAEQERPVRRRVALKVIKLGMDTRHVVARFEQERQALALMDHPNIAKVLDAGATESGRPYFVMEYVAGDPITTFADAHKLSVRERLELFSQVCSAVQHAHTKGVIHRDIKPRNVLVSMSDGRPLARVIDFGIAKATGSPLTDKTLFTEHRQLIGTPEYMSPEQAEGSPDIDTRTDIYALGVLLYELLTGATPFDAVRLRSAAFAEMQRIIKEEDPLAPSLRLSRSLATLAVTAAARQAEPGKLGGLIKGELDWIVMKALDKDRARRYESPNQFAADVQRHVAGEPVIAAPPSTTYRMRKFVRKHRGRAITAFVLATTLLLASIVSTTSYRSAVAANATLKSQNEKAVKTLKHVLVQVVHDEASDFVFRGYSLNDGTKVIMGLVDRNDPESEILFFDSEEDVRAFSGGEAPVQTPMGTEKLIETFGQIVIASNAELEEQVKKARLAEATATLWGVDTWSIRGMGWMPPNELDRVRSAWQTRLELLGANDSQTLEAAEDLSRLNWNPMDRLAIRLAAVDAYYNKGGLVTKQLAQIESHLAIDLAWAEQYDEAEHRFARVAEFVSRIPGRSFWDDRDQQYWNSFDPQSFGQFLNTVSVDYLNGLQADRLREIVERTDPHAFRTRAAQVVNMARGLFDEGDIGQAKRVLAELRDVTSHYRRWKSAQSMILMELQKAEALIEGGVTTRPAGDSPRALLELTTLPAAPD